MPMQRGLILTALGLLAWLACTGPAWGQASITHPQVCTQAATPSTSDIDCPDWNAEHTFGGAGAAQGRLLYHDTGESDKINWTAEVLYDETNASFRLFDGGVGTSGVNILSLGCTSTDPTTSPADTVQVWCKDQSAEAGSASLQVRDERGAIHALFGTSATSGYIVTRSTSSVTVAADASNSYVGSATNHPLVVLQNNTARAIVDPSGNVIIGPEGTVGSSAAGVLYLPLGTDPTTSPADKVGLWGKDTDGAGTTGLALRGETGHVHRVGRLHWLPAGDGTGLAKTGGVLDSAFADVATGANTTETTLYTFTVPASTLSVNGQALYLTGTISFSNNANDKTIRFKFGATTLVTQTLTDTTGAASAMNFRLRIIRTGAATQRVQFSLDQNTLVGSVAAVYATAAETLSGALAIAVTGQNGTAAANDIIFRLAKLSWEPE